MKQFQEHVKNIEVERGLVKTSALEIMLLLVEEFGELAKAIRKRAGMKTHTKSDVFEVQDEIGDFQILLASLANWYEIDLIQASMRKIEKDAYKVYQSD